MIAKSIAAMGRSCESRGTVDEYALNMHSVGVEIEFDPDKAQSNLRKHRVSFAHAEQSLRDERAVTIDDPDRANGAS